MASAARPAPAVAARLTASGLTRRFLVALTLAAALFPFIWVVRVATKPEDSYIRDPSGLGGGLTWDNFSTAWQSGTLGRGFVNSLAIVPLGALIATVLAAMAGYALSKLRPFGTKIFLGILIVAISVPTPAIVIPLFTQGLDLGYADSRVGLSILYGGLFASWGTFFVYSFFKTVPDALIDAARVEGASEVAAFVRVAIPLSRPALVATFLINLFIQWSELLLGLVMLSDPSKHTITVGIAVFTTELAINVPPTAAAMIIASTPILVIYLAAQRFIRPDAFGGALKH